MSTPIEIGQVGEGRALDRHHLLTSPLWKSKGRVDATIRRILAGSSEATPAGNGGIIPVNALDVALDERDTVTHDHCDRVSRLALELGRHVGLAATDLRCLALAARLHDVGKIGIPDGVLKKPGKLTDDEWVVMKTHSAKSERIVLASNLDDADLIAKATRHHHERYDGRGYPDGLSGEAIPVTSRIVAIVDTYDAMARLRLYGEPVSHRAIMTELASVAGTQHDAYLSGAFARIIDASRFRTV